MADKFSELFIHATTSPRVMKQLADRKITLNVCPTSNIMLGYAKTLTAKHLYGLNALQKRTVRKLHQS